MKAFESEENENIQGKIDGVVSTIPLDPRNRHYVEIMLQVDADELTIAAAD